MFPRPLSLAKTKGATSCQGHCFVGSRPRSGGNQRESEMMDAIIHDDKQMESPFPYSRWMGCRSVNMTYHQPPEGDQLC